LTKQFVGPSPNPSPGHDSVKQRLKYQDCLVIAMEWESECNFENLARICLARYS